MNYSAAHHQRVIKILWLHILGSSHVIPLYMQIIRAHHTEVRLNFLSFSQREDKCLLYAASLLVYFCVLALVSSQALFISVTARGRDNKVQYNTNTSVSAWSLPRSCVSFPACDIFTFVRLIGMFLNSRCVQLEYTQDACACVYIARAHLSLHFTQHMNCMHKWIDTSCEFLHLSTCGPSVHLLCSPNACLTSAASL